MARPVPALYFMAEHCSAPHLETSLLSDFRNGSHSRLAMSCRYDIDQVPDNTRQTSIVCTLGKSWRNAHDIEKMIKAGMNILLLNMSLTDHDTCKEVIKTVRQIEQNMDYATVCGIAMDMTLAPVRTGFFEGSQNTEVEVKENSKVELTLNEQFKHACSAERIFIDTKTCPQIIHSLHKGDKIYLDDGLISLIAKDFGFDSITCVVDEGGYIGSFKRVTFPRDRVYQNSVQANYIKDLQFAAECDVDFVFTSFSDNASMLDLGRKYLPSSIKLFAKVETRDAVRNLSSLIQHSDGLIIRRSDLALHYTPEKIFKLQKYIIGHCNVAQRPVFVIEQLLESMCSKPRPTRAESSDVANAVLDGADGLILTMETSWGQFPFESVEVIDHICREAERAIAYDTLRMELKQTQTISNQALTDILHVTGASAVEASSTSDAKAILVITSQGISAMTIAASRPQCPTVAITTDPKIGRHCYAYRGLIPFIYTGESCDEWVEDVDLRLNAALDFIREKGIVKPNDKVIIVTNSLPSIYDSTNTMQVITVPEEEKKKLKIVSSAQDLEAHLKTFANTESVFDNAEDTLDDLPEIPREVTRQHRFSVMLGSAKGDKKFFGVNDLSVPL